MNGADLVDEIDAAELLNDNGLPRGPGPRMVDDGAETVAMSRKERDGFVDHIARLQQRLTEYEAGDELAGNFAPLTADQRADMERRVGSLQAELRVAEDAIREHIRQKARLRDQVAALSKAGGGGVPSKVRTGLVEMPDRVSRLVRAMVEGLLAEITDAGRERTEPPSDATVPPPDRSVRADEPAPRSEPRVCAVVEPSGPSLAAVGGRAGGPDSSAAAPAAPSTDAPVNGKARPRPPGGWFAVTLARLGGVHTAREVAAADNRVPTAGIQAAINACKLGRVEACGARGRSPLYRIKA